MIPGKKEAGRRGRGQRVGTMFKEPQVGWGSGTRAAMADRMGQK